MHLHPDWTEDLTRHKSQCHKSLLSISRVYTNNSLQCQWVTDIVIDIVHDHCQHCSSIS